MKRVLLISAFLFGVFGLSGFAQTPETFDQAKTMAAEENKPVLMEFLRPG